MPGVEAMPAAFMGWVEPSDNAAMSARLMRRAPALVGALALLLASGTQIAGAAPASSTTVTGPITGLGSSWFSLQTAGRRVGVINALTSAATKITNADTPYVWAGGHAEAGVASTGSKGPGYTGRRRGFDCSGAVAAVLAGAGLWPSGASVPSDNGVIAELAAQHLIAPGLGSAPNAVTLYDESGVHIFMNIDGRFFGTSDGSGGGDAAGGAGWLADGASDATSPLYRRYHFLPSVLAQQTSYGNDFTFQVPVSGLFSATQGSALGISLGELSTAELLVGERVSVSYSTIGTGAMLTRSIAVISGGPALTPPTTTATSPSATVAPVTTTPVTTTPPPSSSPTVPAPGTPVSVSAQTSTVTTATPISPARSSASTASGGAAVGTGGFSATGGAPLGSDAF